MKMRERLINAMWEGHYLPALGAELVDRFRAVVLRESGWVPCSPEWLAAHPGECGTASRIAGTGDVSHWHPKVTRAEVLREGADRINALPQDYECDPGRGDAATLLRRMADEAAGQSSALSEPRHADGQCPAFQPGDLCTACGESRRRHRASEASGQQVAGYALGAWTPGGTDEPDAPDAPKFFRPDHTYARDSHGRTVEFRVTHIETSPDGNHRCAIGWHRVEGYDEWLIHTTEDLGDWTEVHEDGEQRQAICDCLPPHAPHKKLPCGHCAMDVCEACKTCAGSGCRCNCGAGEPRA